MRIDIWKKQSDTEDQTDGNERKAIIEKKKKFRENKEKEAFKEKLQ